MKRILFLLLLIALLAVSHAAQDWSNLVPLVSTCEDVKEQLGVEDCRERFSDYKLAKYDVTVEFSEANNEWKVPKGRVVSMTVRFKEMPTLEIFETSLYKYVKDKMEFRDYAITKASTSSKYQGYKNNKAGIEWTIFNDPKLNESLVENVTIYPPEKIVK